MGGRPPSGRPWGPRTAEEQASPVLHLALAKPVCWPNLFFVPACRRACETKGPADVRTASGERRKRSPSQGRTCFWLSQPDSSAIVGGKLHFFKQSLLGAL